MEEEEECTAGGAHDIRTACMNCANEYDGECDHEGQLRTALGLGDDFEGGWLELLEVVRNDYRQLRAARKALEL